MKTNYVLFLNCRSTLEDMVSSGILSKLLVSFSRDDQPASDPRYVQDNMRVYKHELVDLLYDRGAHLYICGDAKNMAQGVNDTLIEILSDVKGKYDQSYSNFYRYENLSHYSFSRFIFRALQKTQMNKHE